MSYPRPSTRIGRWLSPESFIRPGQQAVVPNLPSTAAHTVPQPETGLIAAATTRASAEARKHWRVSYSIRIGFFQTIV
jgi:hypothetical protein